MLNVDIATTTTFKAIFIKTPFGLPASNSDNYVLYPNPGNGKFSLYLHDLPNGGYEMVVHNALGQLVHTEKTYTINRNGIFNPDLSRLPNGLYTIAVWGAGQRKTFKYIKSSN